MVVTPPRARLGSARCPSRAEAACRVLVTGGDTVPGPLWRRRAAGDRKTHFIVLHLDAGHRGGRGPGRGKTRRGEKGSAGERVNLETVARHQSILRRAAPCRRAPGSPAPAP